MGRFFFFFLFFICNISQAQKLNRSNKQLLSYLKNNLTFLASDELQGRRAGDPGEKIAADFIASKFAETNLIPKGDNNTFLQRFAIYDGKVADSSTQFSINDVPLLLYQDFFPLPFSGSGTFDLELSPSINEKGQPWFYDLNDIIEANYSNPHFDLASAIYNLSKNLNTNGASAIIFYYSGTGNDPITFDSKNRDSNLPFPVLYLNRSTGFAKINDIQKTHHFKSGVSIIPKYRYGNNVIGYLDNKAKHTIIVGAHYDHLGYGQDGNSMIRNGVPSIHNGADDNASGTTGLIELSFLLKKAKYKHSNVLFLAFSAEELGLNGSKYFTENPTIDLNSVNYMINMDMIGRLNDSSKVVTIGGYGTSSSWSKRLYDVKSPIVIRIDSSGSGPSDHTSFYRKNIPVLFFFTGLHTDYHKPTDDADKINYLGLLHIVRYINSLIIKDNGVEKIDFLKTREQQTSTSARFSVSLGIMPDYAYTQFGVRVDGVSDNRPAKTAGIQAGDIILQIGDFKTSSVESYMQALSKFKKGDRTKVIYKRRDVETTVDIEFK